MTRSGAVPPPIPPPVIGYATPVRLAQQSLRGIWRAGNQLVVPKDAPLPPRCVKCNADVESTWRWRKTMYWHHPGFYAVLLASPLIFVIIHLVVRKQSLVNVALCDDHRSAYRRSLLIGWMIALAGLISLGGSAFVAGTPGYRGSPVIPTLVIGGVVLIIASLVWAVAAVRVVVPKRIDARFAWLAGAGPAFLDSLPSVDQPL